jgi:uncharacterized protein
MEQRSVSYSASGISTGASLDVVQRRVLNQVFLWMSLGLALSGAVAWFTAGSDAMKEIIFGNRLVFWGLIIAQVGMVWIISGLINRMSAALAAGLFFLYAGLNGLTLASIFLVYNLGSIAGVFLITAGTFGTMSIYGLTTKRDLTSWGNLLFMALIGLIIASVVNIFLQSGMFRMIISAVGVLVFVGLTAYDSQKIKEMAATAVDGESEGKIATLGALSLYLDFINLFLMLLNLFGGRKSE